MKNGLKILANHTYILKFQENWPIRFVSSDSHRQTDTQTHSDRHFL